EPVVEGASGEWREWTMPERCPECDTPLERPAGEIAWRCPNAFGCPAQRRERLRHFASRGALDIEGLGEANVALLMERRLVEDPSDLFKLQIRDLDGLPGFGPIAAQNLIRGIDRAREPELARLLIALGIRHVGGETATALAATFGSLERLLEADLATLQATPGVGNVAGASVYAWFQADASRAMVERMLERGVRPRARQRSRGPLEGKTFVITGTLAHPRPAVAARIEAAGGKVVGAVSKKIDYLVVGESPGSKVDQARKAGVPVVDEAGPERLRGGAPAAAAGPAAPPLWRSAGRAGGARPPDGRRRRRRRRQGALAPALTRPGERLELRRRQRHDREARNARQRALIEERVLADLGQRRRARQRANR